MYIVKIVDHEYRNVHKYKTLCDAEYDLRYCSDGACLQRIASEGVPVGDGWDALDAAIESINKKRGITE